MAESADGRRTDRQVGWLISLGGSVLIIGQVGKVLGQWSEYSLWWNTAGAAIASTVVLLAALGRVLAFPVLRVGWIGVPVLGWILWLTSFQAFRGGDAQATMALAWTIQPAIASYTVLWTKPVHALVLAVVSGCLPAASALIFTGHIAPIVAADAPIQVSNIAFVAIFIGIRGRLGRLRVAEARAREQERVRASATEEARRQEELGRLIHDEVLSVLTAAMAFTGPPPAELRAEATHALLLLRAPRSEEPDVLSCGQALARITARLRLIDPACPLHTQTHAGTVPTVVVDAVSQAAAEALRNSVRHAGTQCPRAVEVLVRPEQIRVVVSDEGPGFEPDAVSAERLGVRSSIFGRLAGLDGGQAEINSGPDGGTEVILTWRM